MSDDVFQFKISIHGIWPPIWRRILVPAEFTFYEFHVAIQDAMGWKHRQPYAFRGLPNFPLLRISRPQPVGQALLSGIDHKIRRFLKVAGHQAIYEYDSMEHVIELEYIRQLIHVPRPLMCIGGERACPPDGIGGKGRYERHLLILSDPNNIEHAACMAWLNAVGGPFHPEFFNQFTVVFSDAQTRFLSPQTPYHS